MQKYSYKGLNQWSKNCLDECAYDCTQLVVSEMSAKCDNSMRQCLEYKDVRDIILSFYFDFM